MRNLKQMIHSPLFLMALVIFIDFTGFGLVIPLLPFWAEHLGAGPLQIGLLLTIYALAQLIFTPMLGAVSDRAGRKPVVLISLLIEAGSFALTALAGSLPVLFAARAIGGLGASNVGSAQAVVTDVTPAASRAQAMGALGAAIGLGFVVGPALGGVLAPLGPALPFWAAMGVALVNALLVWRFLPETRKRPATASIGRSDKAVAKGATLHAPSVLFAGWERTLRNPAVARLVTINLLYTIAFSGMETVFVLLTQRTFGWTAQQNGYLFAYIGVVIVVMQGGLVGPLVKRFGEHSLLIAGLLLLAIGLVTLPWSTTLALLLLALSLVAIGDGAVTPTVSTLLSFAGPAEAQGGTLGLAQGLAGFGRMVGPLVAGSLFALAVSWPFLLGGALALVGLALALPGLPGRPAAPQLTSQTGKAKPMAEMAAEAESRSLALSERQG